MYKCERWSDRDAAIALFEENEPAATAQLALLLEGPLSGHRKLWRAVDESGHVGGVLLVDQQVWDRWYAFPLLFDEAAAPPMADVVNDSPVRTVVGRGDHVVPVATHLTRLRASEVMPWSASERPFPDPGPTQGVRVAEGGDLDALVDLYSTYELNDIPTLPRLRKHLKPMVDRGHIFAAELDGKLVGALTIEFATPKWWTVNGLTVLPEARGHNIGWEILKFAMHHVSQTDIIGSITSRAFTNPMEGKSIDSLIDEYLEAHPEMEDKRDQRGQAPELDNVEELYVIIHLSRRWRFRGQGQLWKLIERIEGRTKARPAVLVREVTRLEDVPKS
jgi:GNAT superfamily N-acetyltransferase